MTDVARRDTLIAKVKRRGGRGDRSPLGAWFFDVDRMLLGLTCFLIAIGLIAVAAASPATAGWWHTTTVAVPARVSAAAPVTPRPTTTS